MDAKAPWPDGIRAVFTTRHGGVSGPPFDSWNLGDHVNDQVAAVGVNRRLLAQRTAAHPVFLKQVHGSGVIEVDHQVTDGVVADACWTQDSGLACTVMVADCLPVLLSDSQGRSVAAAHAGWRGLAGYQGKGILEALFDHWPAAMDQDNRSGIVAWLGPCIGPQAFEVGPEVREAFVDRDPEAQSCFSAIETSSQNKYLCHLAALARRRLNALGVEQIHGNDGSDQWCTVQQPSLFFSHRRDSGRFGTTGRMAACIWKRS